MHDYATNPGSDERVRELEREARSSGDPLVAYQAYVARRGAGLSPAEREHADSDPAVIATPHGQLRIAVTGSSYGLPHAYVATHPWDGPEQGTWTINRVPLRWSGHFYRFPDGTWLPMEFGKHSASSGKYYQFTDDQGGIHRAWAEDLADLLSRPSLAGLSVNRPGDWGYKPSSATLKKIVQLSVPIVTAWANANAGQIRAAHLRSANNEIMNYEKKITDLEVEIGELQRKIGEAYLAELGAERENPPSAENPPSEADRAPFYEWVEAYRAGRVTGDEFYRRFPKLSRDALEHDARMAGEGVDMYLVRDVRNREPLYRALRAQVRDASHRQLADYEAYFGQTMVSEPDWRGGPVPEDYYAANPQGV